MSKHKGHRLHEQAPAANKVRQSQLNLASVGLCVVRTLRNKVELSMNDSPIIIKAFMEAAMTSCKLQLEARNSR